MTVVKKLGYELKFDVNEAKKRVDFLNYALIALYPTRLNPFNLSLNSFLYYFILTILIFLAMLLTRRPESLIFLSQVFNKIILREHFLQNKAKTFKKTTALLSKKQF